MEETYNRSIRRICDMEKPVVAAVNGVAAGAGPTLRWRVTSWWPNRRSSSSKRLPTLAIPDSGNLLAAAAVGMARAKALTMLGTPLLATEAQDMGLIHQAVDEDAFAEAVGTLASKLANMPTRGLGLTKKALHAAMTQDLHAQLKLELDLQFKAAETDDYAEGVQAFLEKRKPQFKGT